MPRKDAIRAEGAVVGVLTEMAARVELANGHRLMAHLSGRLRLEGMRLAPGDRVTLEISPYDLSKGCVIERQMEVKL